MNGCRLCHFGVGNDGHESASLSPVLLTRGIGGLYPFFRKHIEDMEYFEGAKAVKLKSVHHAKCLWADDDRHSVAQKREKEGKQDMTIIWKVEHVPERNTIRLKSRYDLYLMASDYHFLLGATGKKVMQSFASKADSSCEWEPISDGEFVKLKTKNETFLRANGGLPPWRNSVTHDVPVLANTRDSIFWDVEIVERRVQEPHVISQRLQAQVS